MNFKQNARVPNRGSGSEKTTQTILEFVSIAFFLLSLFLTGCSGSLVGGSHASGGSPVVQLTGEPVISNADAPLGTESVATDGTSAELAADGTRVALNAPVASGATTSQSVLASFIEEEAVRERVRIVTGWLKFVRQDKASALLSEGWARLQAGRILGPLDSRPNPHVPNLSKTELMLWRELVQEAKIPNASGKRPSAEQLESLALILAVAQTPDDLMGADNLLVVSEAVAGY